MAQAPGILRWTSPHAARLERWLGAEQVEHLSSRMRGFHGPIPIAVANIPGTIYVTNTGDFVGAIRGGYYSTLADLTRERLRRAWQRTAHRQLATCHAGFSSLSDLISEATSGGKKQDFMFAKAGVTGVANIANSLFDVGANPAAGTVPTAATGASPTNATTGAIRYTNPSGGDTLHFVNATSVATVANNMLLLYDNFYHFNHNIATDPQAVSDTPTRYQDTTAINNFITVFVSTALGAGTPTYTITYVDQDGNTAEAAAAQTVVGSAIARRFPFANTVGNGWFIPLNSADYGVRRITNLDLSAASTGNFHVVLAKPYVWIPQGIANFPVIIDGINSAFNLVKITDSSALCFMEVNKGATTATNYSGMLTFVAG